MGAVIYLRCCTTTASRTSTSTWDRALNFDGETGPYVQYTHARALLRAAQGRASCRRAEPDYSALAAPEAQDVVRCIEQFPDGAARARSSAYEPSMITRFSVDLAQAFNKFYYECRILDDDLSARKAKLLLTDASRQVLAIALNLIGIAAPERM